LWIYYFLRFYNALPLSGVKLLDGFEWNCTGGADKSLARPGGKQATATEDFDVYIAYL